MNYRLISACLVLTLISGLTPAIAKDLKMTWSGWSRSSQDVDSNGDREPGLVSQQTGTGSLGKAVSTGVVENDTWDGTSFCAFNDSGQPEGILLTSIGTTNVIRTANGDLVYNKIANSPPSTVCFNFVTSKAMVETYLDITGGTGRYEGATGSSIRRLKVDVLDGINGATGTEQGQIFLQHVGKD